MKLPLPEKRKTILIPFVLLSMSFPAALLRGAPPDPFNSPASISVSISASNSGVVNCAHPTTTLTASTTASGSTSYRWTGPGGFSASGASVTVSVAGTYTVTGTHSSQTGSASKTVSVNTSTPDLSVTGATLGCASQVTIGASSSVSGATYAWTGPNDFSSTSRTPIVSAGGIYTVTVKNPSTGCTATRTTTVASGLTSLWLENFSLTNGTRSDNGATSWSVRSTPSNSVFSVQGNEFRVSNTGSPSGTESVWASETIDITGKIDVTVSASIRSAANPGPLNNSGSLLDYLRFYYKINGGSEVLFNEHKGSINNNGTVNSAISVRGLSGASIQIIVRARATGSDEFYYFDDVQVSGTTPPDLTATGGSLGCKSEIRLNASSSVPGASYAWTGPNGFNSNAANPVVSAAGSYTVMVTNPVSGCTSSKGVTVASGLSSLWLEGFSLANGTRSDAGSTPWSVVSTPSNSVFSVQGNEFRVSNTGSATGTESVWASGPIDISGKTRVTLTADIRSAANPGPLNGSGPLADYLRFYYKLDGGSEVLFSEHTGAINNNGTGNTTISVGGLSGGHIQVIVRARATGSDEFYYFDNVQVSGTASESAVATGGMINCTQPSLVLSGSSTAAGATYSWTGPNGFSSAAQNPAVSAAGVYTLTTTNPATGCTGSDTANVSQNLSVPPAFSLVSNSGSMVLNCANTSLALQVSASSSNASYNWSGPNGFTASGSNVSITAAGPYLVTATDPVSGCTSTSSLQIIQNVTTPTEVTTVSLPSNGQLGCTQSTVVLTGSSATPGVGYSWSGPEGFTANTASITTTVPGDYALTVTDPANGCHSTATTTVTQNISQPASVTANPSSILTCAQSTVNLTANSTTTGATYLWSGPNGYSSTTRVSSTTAPGAYTVTVTNPASGCTASKTINVQQNINPPANVSIAPPDQLNCDVSSIELTGSSATANVLYIWSGPDDFSDVVPTTTVSTPGDYVLTVIDLGNSCSSTATVTVEQDLTACEAMARKLATGKAMTLNTTTGSDGIQAATGFRYSIYPNPLSNASSVRFTAPTSAHVQVVVYNGTGVREKVLFDGRAEANQPYQLPMEASRLAPGVHFCLIRVDDKIYSSKLLVL